MSRFHEAMPISLTATSTELPDWQHTTPEWPDLALAKMKLDWPRINSGMVPRENEAGLAPHQLRDGAPCVPASVTPCALSTEIAHFPRRGVSEGARTVKPTSELPNLAPEMSNTLNME